MGICCSQATNETTFSGGANSRRREETGESKKMLLDYLSGEGEESGVYTVIDDPTLKRNRSVYKAIKGDQVDEALEALINKYNVALPVIRIANGKYLIGTESKMVMLKNSTCMVRVGGGFERMEEYIERNQESELEKLKKIMNDSGKAYD
jgi:hypothetical protein